MIDGIIYLGATHVYYELCFSVDVIANFSLKSRNLISMRVKYLDFEELYV